MGDLNELESSQTVKIIGSDPSGLEQVPVSSVLDDEGKGRLLVQSQLDSGELIPTITGNFRIKFSTTSTNLSNGSYDVLFTRSGEGLFFGTQLAFNRDNVNIRLRIDGSDVFDISLEDIREFQFNDTSSGRMQLGGFLTTNGNVFDFSSKFAIPYTTSVEIAATRNSAGNAQNSNWMVFLTED